MKKILGTEYKLLGGGENYHYAERLYTDPDDITFTYGSTTVGFKSSGGSGYSENVRKEITSDTTLTSSSKKTIQWDTNYNMDPGSSSGSIYRYLMIKIVFTPTTNSFISASYWYNMKCVFGCELSGTQRDFGICIDGSGYFGIGYGTSSFATNSAIKCVSGTKYTLYMYIDFYNKGAATLFDDSGTILAQVTSGFMATTSGKKPPTMGVLWNNYDADTAISGTVHELAFYRYEVSKPHKNGDVLSTDSYIYDSNAISSNSYPYIKAASTFGPIQVDSDKKPLYYNQEGHYVYIPTTVVSNPHTNACAILGSPGSFGPDGCGCDIMYKITFKMPEFLIEESDVDVDITTTAPYANSKLQPVLNANIYRGTSQVQLYITPRHKLAAYYANYMNSSSTGVADLYSELDCYIERDTNYTIYILYTMTNTAGQYCPVYTTTIYNSQFKQLGYYGGDNYNNPFASGAPLLSSGVWYSELSVWYYPEIIDTDAAVSKDNLRLYDKVCRSKNHYSRFIGDMLDGYRLDFLTNDYADYKIGSTMPMRGHVTDYHKFYNWNPPSGHTLYGFYIYPGVPFYLFGGQGNLGLSLYYDKQTMWGHKMYLNNESCPNRLGYTEFSYGFSDAKESSATPMPTNIMCIPLLPDNTPRLTKITFKVYYIKNYDTTGAADAGVPLWSNGYDFVSTSDPTVVDASIDNSHYFPTQLRIKNGTIQLAYILDSDSAVVNYADTGISFVFGEDITLYFYEKYSTTGTGEAAVFDKDFNVKTLRTGVAAVSSDNINGTKTGSQGDVIPQARYGYTLLGSNNAVYASYTIKDVIMWLPKEEYALADDVNELKNSVANIQDTNTTYSLSQGDTDSTIILTGSDGSSSVLTISGSDSEIDEMFDGEDATNSDVDSIITDTTAAEQDTDIDTVFE